jgi:UDP-N-acetylmuramoyl-tripeptide--D-alanyl-D-alanine ligase
VTGQLTAAEVAQWTGGRWDPAGPASIRSVSNNTRALQHGALYVALRGLRYDGHAFVPAAFALGASGAIVDEGCGLAGEASRPLLRVPDTGRALRDLARGYRRKVNPVVIAVTGSVGKSTVKEMIAQCLAAAVPTACTRGNWNNDVGLPLSMLAMRPDAKAGVFEVGTNHPGEIQNLCGVLEPLWGVVTNIAPTHIEYFGSLESIAREKGALLGCLPPGGLAVLDRDGSHFELLRALSQAPVLTVSMRGGADYVCLGRDAGRQAFEVGEKASGERVTLRISQPGEHNVANALMAAAVARAFHVDWALIGAALEGFKALPMRWEPCEAAGLRFVNDAYNSNPLSVRAALRTFEEMSVSGGKWLLLAGMLELGETTESEHWSLGEAAAAGNWRGILAVGELGRLIADAARQAGFDSARIYWCRDPREAADTLSREARPGDTVLMKASRGMHLEEVIRLLSGADGQAGG